MITVNGRRYRLPQHKVALVCLDGCDPAYLDDAERMGLTPVLSRWRREAFFAIGHAQVPTFTNPNNVSIVTGAPASVHGISGNFFLDPLTGAEVPMNDARFLRAPTILAGLAKAGLRVGIVTAKKKLVDLLRVVDGGAFAISVEVPNANAERWAGRAAPLVYSADASLFVLDVGSGALRQDAVDVVYLSTTDFVQHKYAPGSAGARDFYQQLDRSFARLEETGAIIGVTADHGMNAKTREDGSPNVVWLEALLDAAKVAGARVTLPITDPYVVHHGSLGSAAMVHVERSALDKARRAIKDAPGVIEAFEREEAAQRFELPADRIGDLLVLSDRTTVLGKRPEAHDLTAVGQGLRSHGGLDETAVPLIVSRPVRAPERPLRNWDLFALALG